MISNSNYNCIICILYSSYSIIQSFPDTGALTKNWFQFQKLKANDKCYCFLKWFENSMSILIIRYPSDWNKYLKDLYKHKGTTLE